MILPVGLYAIFLLTIVTIYTEYLLLDE